ncbi:MAG: AAA family ATPase [Lachnospiraceae bacterium]|nr:AAA family ATPase [Lachnospiraceae bacterium]
METNLVLKESGEKTVREIMSAISENTEEERRLSTGIPEIDKAIGGGIKPSSLTAIAGKPGSGKTSLLLQVGSNMAASGMPVLLFETEITSTQAGSILLRQASYHDDSVQTASTVDADNVNVDETNMSTVNHLADDLAAKYGDQFYIVSRSDWDHTVDDVLRISEQVIEKYQLSEIAVMIDYIQNMLPSRFIRSKKNVTTKDVVDDVLAALGKLRNDYDATIIIASAIHRDFYTTTNVYPLQCLRDSSQLECDADLILALQLHNGTLSSEAEEMSKPVRNMDVNIIKQRFDAPGLNAHCDFHARYGTFTSHKKNAVKKISKGNGRNSWFGSGLASDEYVDTIDNAPDNHIHDVLI